MKRWVGGVITGLLAVGLAWTYHQTALSVVQEYLSPEPGDPVPTLQLIARNYRLLVLGRRRVDGAPDDPGGHSEGPPGRIEDRLDEGRRGPRADRRGPRPV